MAAATAAFVLTPEQARRTVESGRRRAVADERPLTIDDLRRRARIATARQQATATADLTRANQGTTELQGENQRRTAEARQGRASSWIRLPSRRRRRRSTMRWQRSC